MRFWIQILVACSTAITLVMRAHAAPPPAQQPRKPVREVTLDPAPRTFELTEPRVEVPLTGHGTQLRIDCRIDGSAPYRFQLDTGGGFLLIREDLARGLGLERPAELLGDVAVSIDSGSGGGVPARFVSVDTLDLGDVHCTGITALACAVPHMPEAGIVGFGFFRGRRFTIDFPRRVLVMERDPGELGEGALPYRCLQSGFLPAIDLEVGGRPIPFAIDTGFDGWIALDEATAGAIGLVAPPVEGHRELLVDRARRMRLARLAGSFELCGTKIEEPIVRLGSGAGPLLGTALLEHFSVTFDTPSSRVLLSSIEPAVRAGTERTTGVELRTDQAGRFWIDYVLPGSPAESAGVRAGDRLLAAEGRAMEELSADEWLALRERETVTLKLSRTIEGAATMIDARVAVLVLVP